ncbi:MAG: proline--tRNA ligase [Clostridiaceae bacterium]|nr:proline--tRNA ligase [Clostridiaceae bacterium]
MKLSENYFYTLREDAKDEESVSGNLLVKSGMIKKIGNGIYMKMPLGQKVVDNVKNIVRKNMNMAGALEVTMPMLLPIDVFQKSGRYELFGPSIFKLNDRYNRPYVLGPTHEEFFVLASMMKAKSYKDFPYTLYQIGNKYRDEIRPRLGLIRTREFTMKDAYSFDINQEESDKSYQKQFDAYHKICKEVGLNYAVVRADTGVMGGLLSEEFQAITDVGEDILVLCDNCDYASNIEVSKCIDNETDNSEEKLQIEKIYTPNAGTIEEISTLLKVETSKFVKTLIYNVDGKFYACLVAGDKEVNEVKLGKLLNAKVVELAEADNVIQITNAKVGFAGPVGLNIPVIMDHGIAHMKNFIVGANDTDYHYKNVNLEDFEIYKIADIRNVKENDICPNCGKGHLTFKKGIEVGNTFKLGTKYSESLGLNYSDENNELKPVVMGCYGIGIERIIAALVEQNHDDKGIIWPINIAPFKVAIVLISNKDDKQKQVAQDLYEKFTNAGIETILDDRDERPGVKFNDMDLIGIPLRITVGKKVEENQIEFKSRSSEEVELIDINDILDKIKNIIK